MQADLIISGGVIETMDAEGSVVEAAAVQGGRFVAVGSWASVSQWAGPGTRHIDLGGAALLPGFWDTHMHFEKIAGELAMVHLDAATTIADVLAAIARKSSETPPGEWVQSFGDDGAWHEAQLAEARLPTRAELGRVAPEHPVFLFRGPDTVALNSAAVDALSERLTSDFAAGWQPETALLRHPSAKVLQRSLPAPNRARRLEMLGAASRDLLRMGITGVVDPGLPAAFDESWALYREALATGHLAQRVYLMNRFDYRRSFEDEMARLLRCADLPMDGDDRIRAWAVKLLLDGEFVDGWMRSGEPAAGPATIRYSVAQIDEVLTLCATQGWPLCVHALGGGAIDFMVERVRRAVEAGLHFWPGQISLAHAFFPSQANLHDCRALNIALAVQPLLMYLYEREMTDAWGTFALGATPMASILAAGVLTAGGSDVLPCEPLRGARMAVDRRARRGMQFDAAESLSPRQALELFTRHAGPYIHRTDIGVIAVGSRADFVLWSANPLHTPPAQWLDLRVHLAAINGQIVLG